MPSFALPHRPDGGAACGGAVEFAAALLVDGNDLHVVGRDDNAAGGYAGCAGRPWRQSGAAGGGGAAAARRVGAAADWRSREALRERTATPSATMCLATATVLPQYCRPIAALPGSAHVPPI
jgi:hypothetical protein